MSISKRLSDSIRMMIMGFVILFGIVSIIGSGSTYTYVTYSGNRLPESQVASLTFYPNTFPMPPSPGRYSRIDLMAIDGSKVDNSNNSKWNSNEGPYDVELMPGSHSLTIEYFYSRNPGGTISYPSGNSIFYQRFAPSPRQTIAIGTVTFTAEAGKRYALKVNDEKTKNTGILNCTIEDWKEKNVDELEKNRIKRN